MQDKEIKQLKALVDKEIAEGNFEDLIEIKRYIQAKLSNNQQADLEEAQFNLQYGALTQPLKDFMANNIKNQLFNGARFRKAVCVLSKCDGPVYVYHTLGLNKEELAARRRIGHGTIDIYEKVLSLYGLSMDNPLTEAQTIQLEQNGYKVKGRK